MTGNAWDDTELGGGRREFPATRWSKILGSDDDDAAASMEDLALRYWKPVYAYIRVKGSRSNEDAKDLTQEFFAWMLESGFLRQADPRRGRFRSFVKVALEHFMSNDRRDRGALKRGGGRWRIAMEDADGRLAVDLPDPAGRTPGQVLDEMWKQGLMSRAAELLEEGLRREGKEVHYLLFRDFHLSPSGEIDYHSLAARHGITEKDVGNYLAHAKKKFRSHFTGLVAETVNGREELDDELRDLLGGEAK